MALTKTQRISILLVIDIAFFLLEIVVGYAVHSLALVADAFHMFNDILSLLVGLWAVQVASSGKTSKTYTYGWQRAETLGALVNGVFLVALCVTIVLEAIQRFVDPPEISNPKLVLIVGACGLASNILGLFLFHEHGHGHGHGHAHGHSHGPEATAEEGHAGTKSSEPRQNFLETAPHESNLPSSPSNKVTVSINAGSKLPTSTDEYRQSSPRKARRSSASRYAFNDVDDIPISASEIRRSIIQASNYGGADPLPEAEEENGVAGISENTPLLESSRSNYGTKTASAAAAQETSGYEHVQPPLHVNSSHEEHGQSHGHGHSHNDLNMQGVFLHVMGDALGNIGVIAAALFIWLTDYWWRFYSDPLISLIITIIILCSAIPLCRATSRILLQGVPPGINIDAIQADIERLDHIVSCHHLHVWQLSDTKLVASLHVQIEFTPNETEDTKTQTGRAHELYMKLAKEIHQIFHSYGIDSSTIQPEFCTDTSHRHLVPKGSGEEVIVGDADENAPLVVDAAETCLLECDASCGNSINGQCCDPLVSAAAGSAAAPIVAAGPSSSGSTSS